MSATTIDQIFRLERGQQPLVAAAIHDGHRVRPPLEALLALSEAERLREEDPFTASWTSVARTRVVGLRSRFEVDLNRPREQAVYIHPRDAWGLQVWKAEPGGEIVEHSLAEYDAFYAAVHELFSHLEKQFGKFVIFDLHTYNHRRQGTGSRVADPELNPEVNIGTGTMERALWAPVVERLMRDLRNFDFAGRRLDVRENVKFQGGQFPRWTHQNFPASACAIAIEWKKFFMDEWSGEPDVAQVELIRRALESAVPGVLEELAKL